MVYLYAGDDAKDASDDGRKRSKKHKKHHKKEKRDRSSRRDAPPLDPSPAAAPHPQDRRCTIYPSGCREAQASLGYIANMCGAAPASMTEKGTQLMLPL